MSGADPQAPRLDPADHAGVVPGEADHVAVLGDQRLLDPALAGALSREPVALGPPGR